MQFDIISIDPPYVFNDSLRQSETVKRSAQDQYDVLSLADIKKLKIKEISKPDCLIALWVPSSMLQDGLNLLKEWGFKYKQTWIWVKTKQNPLKTLNNQLSILLDDFKKDQLSKKDLFKKIEKFDLHEILNFGMGHLGRNVHEVVLLGTKGKIYKKLKNKSQRTVFFYKNEKHSKKPEIFQDRLELMFPDTDRLEIFGRRARANWTVIGNQAPLTYGEDINLSIDNLIHGQKNTTP